MLFTAAVALFVVWMLALGVFNVAGGMIHLLLLVAVLLLAGQLIAERRRAW